MVVLLHGAVGGWDEVAIAVAAFVVLWVAVKVAGRKPAGEHDDHELSLEGQNAESAAEEVKDPAHSSSRPG
jgi:hypothetical protein